MSTLGLFSGAGYVWCSARAIKYIKLYRIQSLASDVDGTSGIRKLRLSDTQSIMGVHDGTNFVADWSYKYSNSFDKHRSFKNTGAGYLGRGLVLFGVGLLSFLRK